MKAVIMAGGAGERLRPLTQTMPKPLARLCGRPVIQYILELLWQNGIQECVVTAGYQAERLRQELPQIAGNLRVRVFEEPYPLGTAGGVRFACPEPEEVLVISGDALCDFPLSKAILRHTQTGAAATIVTTHVEDPREYGMILEKADGFVQEFVEKPSFSQATRNLANTGIYILSAKALEAVPQQQKYDFASDLFPRMLREGERIYSCPLEGYWCDIGDLDSYRAAQRALLHGQVRTARPVCSPQTACDAHAYTIKEPVYIGHAVTIGAGAVIGPDAVLDDGCTVEADACVDGGILLPGCFVGEQASVREAVVCERAKIGARARVDSGAAVGANAVIGADAVIRAGVHLEEHVHLEPGGIAGFHLRTSGRAQLRFDDDGLRGEVVTPELAARLGRAVGLHTSGKAVGLGHDGRRCSSLLVDALAAGVCAAGESVLDFGRVLPPAFDFGLDCNALPIGLYVDEDQRGDVGIRILSAGGLPAERTLERPVELVLARSDPPGLSHNPGDRLDQRGMEALYQNELMRICPAGLTGMRAHAVSPNERARVLLNRVLARLDAFSEEPGALTLHLAADARSVELSDTRLRIDRCRTVTAYGLTLFEAGQDVAVENEFPRAIDALAASYGRTVHRYLLCPADGSDRTGRRLAARQQYTRDGLRLALHLLGYMRERRLDLAALDARLPVFAVRTSELLLERSPAGLLERFPGKRVGEGVLVEGPRGAALVRARKAGGALRIFAEAQSAETAEELCGDLTARIRMLLDKEL